MASGQAEIQVEIDARIDHTHTQTHKHGSDTAVGSDVGKSSRNLNIWGLYEKIQ